MLPLLTSVPLLPRQPKKQVLDDQHRNIQHWVTQTGSKSKEWIKIQEWIGQDLPVDDNDPHVQHH